MLVVPFLAKSPSWIVSQKEHLQTAPWSPPSATLAVPVEEDPREHFGSAIALEHLVVIIESWLMRRDSCCVETCKLDSILEAMTHKRSLSEKFIDKFKDS